MRKVARTVAAPEGLGTDVVWVPEGSDLELDLRLEAVMEGVLVSGTIRGEAAGECVRCLGDVRFDLDVPFMELYVYPGRAVEETDDEDEVRELGEDDLIDLEPALRDAVVPALPFKPVCRDDCPGLCSECGARLADEPGHTHEIADPRWAALQGILEQGVPAGPSTVDDPEDEKEL
jgi:uncharacterized protein